MNHCMDCGAASGDLHRRGCASFERDPIPARQPVRTVVLFVPYLGPSTNSIYGGLHWAKRKKAKDEACRIVAEAVEAVGLGLMDCRVDLVFRPRLGKGVRRRDTSNASMNAKLIEDALVKAGVLADDTEQHVRRVILEPAEIDREAVTGTWVEMVEVMHD